MTPSWPQDLAHRLSALGLARHLLVCTDYDGTMVPLAPSPSEAQCLPGAIALLQNLARLPNTRVAVISGRSQQNLREHSGLDDSVFLIGSHGAELPTRVTSVIGTRAMAQLSALASTLELICAERAGAWIELKPFGMTVHVRQCAPADAGLVLTAVRHAVSKYPEIRIKEGKFVLELSISQADKGRAVQWLLNDWGVSPAVIFLGDDVTDEDGFRALGPADLGVKVGAGDTQAPYRVASEQDALAILKQIWMHRSSLPNSHEATQIRMTQR